MNFFAHAVVASWADADSAHVLGSMVPDFESMVGLRLLRPEAPAVQRGIDFHHRSDQVFHSSPDFVDLCKKALAELTRLEVRRGSARAVAHIGAEMFLDGLLARDPSHAEVYLSALRGEEATLLRWPDDGAAFSVLSQRLRAWGAPTDYLKPDFVLARLERTLEARPKLRILQPEREAIAEFLPQLREEVELRAAELLKRVRSGLALPG